MKRKSKMKKTLKLAVAYSLVSTMVLAAPAYAEDTNNGLSQGTGTSASTGTGSFQSVRVSFPDVAPDHWAIKHITKLAVEGIVQGDDLGLYNPENSVSRQDVIIMAIRMMGLEGQLESNAVIGPIEVRDDARPYVAMAIEKGVLDLQEEYDLGKNWGFQNADREWVAKIVVRAIGKKAEADAKAEFPTAFADNDQIDASAVGYINEAVSLGIVDGFEDNTFRPDGNVTRAQMATFWSRAEKYLPTPSSRLVTGTIMSINGARLTIQDKAGNTSELQLAANAALFTAKDDKARLTPSDIKLYNEVYVLQVGGVAYFVEVTNDEAPMQTISGTLVSVDINNLTATVETNGALATYELASNVKVLDANGNGLSLGSLLENSVIELKRHALIQNAKVAEIVVKQVPVNKTVEGTFKSVDLAAMTVTVVDNTTGQQETYPITDASIFKKGEELFDPANLFDGDIVRVEVKNSKAVSVQIVKQAVEKRDEGKIYSVDKSKGLITIDKGDSVLASYLVSDRILVVLGDNQFGAVQDLMLGDQVKLEINQNKIDKVTVVSRSVNNFTLATVFSYDQENKYLTVTDETGRPHIYQITDSTRLLFDNTELPLSNFQSYLVKGKRVNIVAADSSLLSVQIATRVEGTIVSISATTNEITIKSAGGVLQTYKTMSYASVDKYGSSTGGLADLKPGDYVRGFFDGSQQTVVSLAVRQSQVVHTVAKDVANSKVTVKDAAGNVTTYSLSGLPVHRNGQAAGIADIALDEPLQVTFIGKSPESVQLLDATRGKVTAVDTVLGKVTVTDYMNVSRTVETGTAVTVKRGSNTSTSLASVQVDDRVEIVKDTAGNATILVIPGESRTFQSYNATTKELKLMRRTIADKDAYLLHDKAYIHQGSSLIDPTALKAGDTVTVYLLNDKIVEVAKP
jgi:hypothetical protein